MPNISLKPDALKCAGYFNRQDQMKARAHSIDWRVLGIYSVCPTLGSFVYFFSRQRLLSAQIFAEPQSPAMPPNHGLCRPASMPHRVAHMNRYFAQVASAVRRCHGPAAIGDRSTR